MGYETLAETESSRQAKLIFLLFSQTKQLCIPCIYTVYMICILAGQPLLYGVTKKLLPPSCAVCYVCPESHGWQAVCMYVGSLSYADARHPRERGLLLAANSA